jgi:hypothetical protein
LKVPVLDRADIESIPTINSSVNAVFELSLIIIAISPLGLECKGYMTLTGFLEKNLYDKTMISFTQIERQ